jgi:hypothetical protein
VYVQLVKDELAAAKSKLAEPIVDIKVPGMKELYLYHASWTTN